MLLTHPKETGKSLFTNLEIPMLKVCVKKNGIVESVQKLEFYFSYQQQSYFEAISTQFWDFRSILLF